MKMLKSSIKTYIIQCYYALILLNFVVGGEFQMSEEFSGLNGVKNPLSDNDDSLPNPISEVARQLMEDSLQFEPAKLDFGSCILGTTKTIPVTIINKNQKRGVRLSLITAKDPSFYSTFVETKTLNPRTNMTFNVIFLPWRDGEFSSFILVQTSLGPVKLPVKGFVSDNPYRLKPIVGIKAPLNATLTPEIHLYNPHDRTLQILEIYSSGGQFQLELPSGGKEGPQNLWKIPAYTTKPIIRIRFHGHSAGNYTAYIRVKVAQQMNSSSMGNNENSMLIPVSFEILPQYGMYLANPLIDFGRIISHSRESNIQFHMQMKNSNQKRQYEFFEGSITDADGFSININDKKLTLHPDSLIGSLRMDKVLTIRYLSKKDQAAIQQFSILVRGEIYRGSLSYDKNSTFFIMSSPTFNKKLPRKITVRNDFDIPLTVMNISIDNTHKDNIDIQTLQDIDPSTGFILNPAETVQLLQIKVTNPIHNFYTNISVHTNVTRFEIPIFVCSGRLHVSTQNKNVFIVDNEYTTELDLGAIALAESSHTAYILLRNPNFIPIQITNWDFQSPKSVYFNTIFLGCFTAAVNERVSLSTVKFKFCSSLEHGEIVVFQITIQSYTTEPQAGILKIWTPYEMIRTEVKFQTWVGKIEVEQEQIHFRNCFPGKKCHSDLVVNSSFKQPIHMTSINFTEPGLQFIELKPKASAILPKTYTKIGRIRFEPAKLCKDDCYIPQDEFTKEIAFPKPRETRGGINNNIHYDDNELRKRIESFRQYKWQYQNIHFTMQTEEIMQIPLEMMIDVEWPRLIKTIPIFPTIEVGKSQVISLELINPADSGVLVDYYLSDPTFAKDTELSLPHEIVNTPSNCRLSDQPVFFLTNANPKFPILIPPKDTLKIPIKFQAWKSGSFCTLLHIRNNMTLYEAAWISGKSAQSQFRLGNRKPGSSNPLHFQVTSEYTSLCSDKNKNNKDKDFAPITLRRTFMAKNSGDIPLAISKFYIGGQECEGYGFRVLDCTPFILKANASRKIDILFRPDFSFYSLKTLLSMKTNLTQEVSYKLVAVIEKSGVVKCLKRMQRPEWEETFRTMGICFMVLVFLLVVILAHRDYETIIRKQAAQYFARDKVSMHPTFNLKNIAMQTRAEEKNNKQKIKQNSSAQSLSASTSNNRNSNGGANYLKKRDVKRYMSGNNEPTYTERQFKLKKEAERALLEGQTRFAEPPVQQALQQHQPQQHHHHHQHHTNGRRHHHQYQQPHQNYWERNNRYDMQTSQFCDRENPSQMGKTHKKAQFSQSYQQQQSQLQWQSQLQLHVQPQPQSQAQSQIQIQTQSSTQPQNQAQQQTTTQIQTSPPKPKNQAQPQTQTQPQVQSQQPSNAQQNIQTSSNQSYHNNHKNSKRSKQSSDLQSNDSTGSEKSLKTSSDVKETEEAKPREKRESKSPKEVPQASSPKKIAADKVKNLKYQVYKKEKSKEIKLEDKQSARESQTQSQPKSKPIHEQKRESESDNKTETKSANELQSVVKQEATTKQESGMKGESVSKPKSLKSSVAVKSEQNVKMETAAKNENVNNSKASKAESLVNAKTLKIEPSVKVENVPKTERNVKPESMPKLEAVSKPESVIKVEPIVKSESLKPKSTSNKETVAPLPSTQPDPVSIRKPIQTEATVQSESNMKTLIVASEATPIESSATESPVPVKPDQAESVVSAKLAQPGPLKAEPDVSTKPVVQQSVTPTKPVQLECIVPIKTVQKESVVLSKSASQSEPEAMMKPTHQLDSVKIDSLAQSESCDKSISAQSKSIQLESTIPKKPIEPELCAQTKVSLPTEIETKSQSETIPQTEIVSIKTEFAHKSEGVATYEPQSDPSSLNFNAQNQTDNSNKTDEVLHSSPLNDTAHTSTTSVRTYNPETLINDGPQVAQASNSENAIVNMVPENPIISPLTVAASLASASSTASPVSTASEVSAIPEAYTTPITTQENTKTLSTLKLSSEAAKLINMQRNITLPQEIQHTEVVNCITSPWETNSQVAFTDVFQTDSMKKVLDDDKAVLYDAGHLIGFGLKNNVEQRKPDLGPIGSRRTPSTSGVDQKDILREALNDILTRGTNSSSMISNIPSYPSVVSQPDIGPSSPTLETDLSRDDSLDDWHDINRKQLMDIRRHQLLVQQSESPREFLERHELLEENNQDSMSFLDDWTDLSNNSPQQTDWVNQSFESSNSPNQIANSQAPPNWLPNNNMRPPPGLINPLLYADQNISLQSLAHNIPPNALSLRQSNINLQRQAMNPNLQQQNQHQQQIQHLHQQTPSPQQQHQQQQQQQQQAQNFLHTNNQTNDPFNFELFKSFATTLSNPWKQN